MGRWGIVIDKQSVYPAQDGEGQVDMPCWLLPLGRLCTVPGHPAEGQTAGCKQQWSEGVEPRWISYLGSLRRVLR